MPGLRKLPNTMVNIPKHKVCTEVNGCLRPLKFRH